MKGLQQQRPAAMLCAVQVIDVMGVTVVVAALPRMIADVGAATSTGGLIVASYAVAFGCLLLLAARLGDRFGHRRALSVGMVLFAVASAVAASADSGGVLVVARVLQGAAAAVSVPNALVLLTNLAGQDDARRQRLLAAWSASGGLAGALGLVVGGVVTSAVGWRAIYWGNVAIAAVILLGLRSLPVDGRRQGRRAASQPGSVPLVSAALQVLGVGSLVVAADTLRRSSVVSLTLVVVAATALTLWVAQERRSLSPLVPRTLWADRAFLRGLVGSVGVTSTTSPFVIVATLWLQDERGHPPAAAGLMVLPFSLAVVASAAVTGRHLPRFGAGPMLVAGLGVIGVGIVACVPHPAVGVLMAAMVVTGAGNAMASVASYALGTRGPTEHRAAAAGLLNTAGQTGTAIGVAVTFAVAQRGAHGMDHRAGWIVAAAAALACVVAVCASSPEAVRLTRGRHRPRA